jgi:hypothetical protein
MFLGHRVLKGFVWLNASLNFFKSLIESYLCDDGCLSQLFDNKYFASLRLCG